MSKFWGDQYQICIDLPHLKVSSYFNYWQAFQTGTGITRSKMEVNTSKNPT